MPDNGQHTGKPISRKDGTGQYVLGAKLGDGGEGEVYEVANDPEWAVKIYKPGKAPRDTQASKLLAMERLKPELHGDRPGHPPLTWPKQIIQERESTELVGLVIPRVNTARTMTMGEFFAPSVRQGKLLKMNMMLDGVHIQRTKWNIIRNLTKTIAQVHERGHLVGDINETNILVEPENGDVSIIDCDSFQVRDEENRIIYLCKVGRPEYTAPELLQQMDEQCKIPQCPNGPENHRTGFPCVSRNKEHDKFGIAVITFQILMDGSHPYDCRIDGNHNAGATTRLEKIKKGYFPYSRSKQSFIHINNQENEKRYSRLPQEVKNMFERAFGPA